MVEKVLVCSYIKHLENDFIALWNLKVEILELGYKDIGCLAYSQQVIL